MLMGEFQHNIDAKGRLIVPSKLREELGEKFVLTRGLDGCLFGYPMSEWENLEAKLNEMPLAKKTHVLLCDSSIRLPLNANLINKDESIYPAR